MFCVFFLETDGYTYSSDVLMGIYETYDEAETAILLFIEKDLTSSTLLGEEFKNADRYEIRQVPVGQELQFC
jgi:hypothetical protein